MSRITKKLRISLTAMAFLMGIGAAFAQYQAEPENVNPSADQFDCQSLLSPSCGNEIQGTIYIADSNDPVESGVYDLQYQQ